MLRATRSVPVGASSERTVEMLSVIVVTCDVKVAAWPYHIMSPEIPRKKTIAYEMAPRSRMRDPATARHPRNLFFACRAYDTNVRRIIDPFSLGPKPISPVSGDFLQTCGGCSSPWPLDTPRGLP